MMKKSSQVGVGGGFTPSPFHFIYHHKQSFYVRYSWEGRYTHPISALPHMWFQDLSDKNIHTTKIRFLIQYKQTVNAVQ